MTSWPIPYDVVEIGLGNNKTFLDYLGGDPSLELQKLFAFLPRKHETHYVYVGVDMVQYLIEELRQKYTPPENLCLEHAAMSYFDEDEISFYAVSEQDAEETRDDDQVQHYLLNMGSTNTVNPYVEERYRHLMKEHRVRQLSYASLCRLYNIGETKILKIDAEGDESNIIRGMIEHCQEQDKIKDIPSPWPWVIQVETNGLGDAKYGSQTEENMLIWLQQVGYRVSVGSYSHNTILVKDVKEDDWIEWFENAVLRIKCNECHMTCLHRGEGRYQWSRTEGEDGFWYCPGCWRDFYAKERIKKSQDRRASQESYHRRSSPYRSYDGRNEQEEGHVH